MLWHHVWLEAALGNRSDLRDQLALYMSKKGLKNTRQRTAILDAFLDCPGHVSLDELLVKVHERKSGVGYATVYRTMKLFVEAGVAEERQFGDGQARYEVVDLEHDHHDHLICTICGHIFEFEDDEIERRQASIAMARGLRITSHRLDLWGECQSPASCEHRARRGASA